MGHSRIPVLHAVKSLGLGGTEKVMQILVQTLASVPRTPDDVQFAPAVWSPRDGERGEQLRESGIPVFIGDDIAAAVRNHRPAVIHVHRAGWPEPELMRPVQALRRRTGRRPCALLPVVVETNVFGRLDDSPSGRDVDSTIFVSHFCAARFEHLHGIPVQPPRRVVLYNPVDTDFLAARTRPPHQRDYSRPVIGRLARADKGKWSQLALSFLPHLVQDFPDLQYRIVGALDEAAEYVRRHGLENNVMFCPPLRDESSLAEFLDGLSVLAHANDAGESFGLAIAEAMACGLPVVTHPCDGWRDNAQTELVEHNITGLVAQTPQEYAQALAFLLRNPDEARRMGTAAQQKAVRCFDRLHITSRLAALYCHLLGIKRSENMPEALQHNRCGAHCRD
ncbi:glycosyltransferase family 4 protein [Oleidesulfovibrio alaskensis]